MKAALESLQSLVEACVAASLLASGCGDNQMPLVTVKVDTGEPSFVAFTVDDGRTWSHPELVGPATFRFEVADEFVFTAVNELEGGAVWAQQLQAAYSDGDNWTFVGASDVGAVRLGDELPPSFALDPELCLPLGASTGIQVSGTMLQPGRVNFAGICDSSVAAPWSFSIGTLGGPHNLIATDLLESNAPRMVVYRGMQVTAPTNVGSVDLSTGTHLEALPVTIDGVDGVDPVSTETIFATETDWAAISDVRHASASGVRAFIAPNSLLERGDVQALQVHSGANLGAIDHGARIHVGDAALPSLVMLTAPSVSLSAGTASWIEPLDGRVECVDVALLSEGSSVTSVQQVTATRSWLDRHSANTVSFDSNIDGYQQTWNIASSGSYSWHVDVRAESATVSYKTEAGGTSTAGASAAPARKTCIEPTVQCGARMVHHR